MLFCTARRGAEQRAELGAVGVREVRQRRAAGRCGGTS